MTSTTLLRTLIPNVQRLNIPDLLSVLIDTTITAEKSHARHGRDTLGDPLILIAVGLVDELVCLNVAVEVVRHEIVVSMVPDSGNHGAKVIWCAKCSLFNFIEHLFQIRVNGVRSVVVGVAQVLYILGQVTKQKDIVFANFTCNLNLWR